MVITDHVINYVEGRVRNGSNLSAIDYSPVRHLDFLVTKEITEAIKDAKEKLDNLVSDLDLATLHFKHWGKTEIKKLGFSPDSFIQMALQLAFYRVQGEPGAQYESGGTRRFIHGRTETIRSCSMESLEFCRTMQESAEQGDKLRLMRAAIEAHNSYAKMAVAGLGVDRHLQGLRCVAKEEGIQLPALYSDPGFLKSFRMRISSSQVSGSSASYLCFGPLVDDGYGVCYNVRKDDILFPCSALRSSTSTSALAYREALEQSLIDMRSIARQNATISKL